MPLNTSVPGPTATSDPDPAITEDIVAVPPVPTPILSLPDNVTASEKVIALLRTRVVPLAIVNVAVPSHVEFARFKLPAANVVPPV